MIKNYCQIVSISPALIYISIYLSFNFNLLIRYFVRTTECLARTLIRNTYYYYQN